ncbi:DUF2062 domain-containing protein [Pseudazoarcus pumilus]|uniref:DUF2062 domain-containing protein n=1 Tax=Pseudazoarcus pumilus TaxID=2067960 RepID=A0A2I6SAV1_9RHOO|nr:DUF2062 domain-containing protein [Pseudazoarcus pumilus]AUN96377.1 DUF2062 domain-containing protein [Pseudazoarcus pumilus]
MIKRYIPSRETIKQNRLLSWLGPRIHDPLLWHVNRNSVARGTAIGVFFGIMLPVAQIPAAAVVALALRANLWVAALTTLVSNPLTYGPIYLIAYRIGSSILPPAATATPVVDEQTAAALQWLIESVNWLTGIGRPLVLGTLIMAVVGAIVGYFGVLLVWRINVLLKLRRQRKERASARRAPDSP